MKSKILILMFIAISSVSLAQKRISWDDLAKVTFDEKYFSEFDEYFLYPNFSVSVKALRHQKVTISGYFLDVDPENNLYILSKAPMASCFFCGVGGPETAIELQFKTEPKFKMDDIVKITGTLELNRDDIYHFNYILKECEGTIEN